MPFVLNLIYLLTLAALRLPCLLYRMLSLGQVSRGLVGEALGRGSAADRRSAVPLVPRGERGRGPAAPAAGERDGAAAAELGGRRSRRPRRPGWPSPGGPFPT